MVLRLMERVFFLIFDIPILVMCHCTTPGNGTGYRHNKMKCSDGSIRFCSSNEECHALEDFEYEHLYDGCRDPGDYFFQMLKHNQDLTKNIFSL